MLYRFASHVRGAAQHQCLGVQYLHTGRDRMRGKSMGRLIKAAFLLVILGFIALTGYAYLADFSPAQGDVTMPVVLNAD